MEELILRAIIEALKIDSKEVIKIEQLPLSGLPSSETHLS